MVGRRDKTERVLEFLEDLGFLTGDVMAAFFDSYPSRHSSRRHGRSGENFSVERDVFSREEQRRFYSFLSLLKKQGLIRKEDGEGRQSKWAITKRGLGKLFAVREKKRYSLGHISYTPEKDSTVRVVIFDIPELERHKRVWLRAALLALDFSFCQQSVWIGKSKIPKKFLEDLRDREMLSYVQIFEVSKKGSLERVDI